MGNVLTAVQGVDWKSLGKLLLKEEMVRDKDQKYPHPTYPTLDKIKEEYQSDDDRLREVVKFWVQGNGKHEKPSWKHLIHKLDWEKMSGVADNIRNFAEPVQGKPRDSIYISIPQAFTSLLILTYYSLVAPRLTSNISRNQSHTIIDVEMCNSQGSTQPRFILLLSLLHHRL